MTDDEREDDEVTGTAVAYAAVFLLAFITAVAAWIVFR